MLTPVLQRVMRGESLSADEMAATMGNIMDGTVNPEQMAAFLVALRIKGETVDEIVGAARAMRTRMQPIKVARRPLIDTCGTGGDGAHTFNISTAVAFVLAAAGVAVAKHGNRAVSSRSGSADVLAALGVNIAAPAAIAAACIDEIGLGFLFAPTWHPAMAHAAPVRKALGVRTIFNVLGPLTNPAGATCQLMGVYDRTLVRTVAGVLGKLGSECAWVVHGAEGLDEISTCDTTYIATWNGREVVEWTLTPEEAGVPRASADSLKGGDAAQNAQLMQEVLAGERTGPLQDAVALNAGAAFCVAGAAVHIRAGVEDAYKILRSGAGMSVLKQLIAKTAQQSVP